PRAYAEVMVAVLNIAGDIAESPDERRAESGLAHLARESLGKRAVARRRGLTAAAGPPSTPPVEATIYADEVYQANLPYVVRHRRRIVGGRPTAEFPDCVAVGSERQWCCSGTLVGSNVVVTAAHCPVDGGCSERVLVGTDTSTENGGRALGGAGVTAREGR